MILFHATYACYYADIMRSGLGGVEHRNWDCSSGVVCLAPDPCVAASYPETAPDCGLVPDAVADSGIVVLRVDATGLLLEDDPNIDDEDDPCLVYDGIIAPSRLSFHRYDPCWQSPNGFDPELALYQSSAKVDA